ncbi:hypothetical protein [Acetobacter lambici]|nr:hypothetical protein [Acetobacter lambici]
MPAPLPVTAPDLPGAHQALHLAEHAPPCNARLQCWADENA